MNLTAIRERPSPNHDARPEGGVIDMLVLHYTGMRTAAAALDRLCDPAAQVSAHYVVEEDGLVWRLVEEGRRAWHAGVSSWRGRTDINARSIGIEIVNPGHEFGYRPFPVLQMAAVAELCRGILARHPIPARNVVGHSDIAPERKQDPGELFDWEGLAADGVGVWPAGVPGEDETPAAFPGEPLARIGYGAWEATSVIAAAQRRWRPGAVTGRADAGTVARLAAVAALVG